jgi:hypothetical protein
MGKYNLIEIERNLKEKIPGLLPLFKVYLPKVNLKVMPLPRPKDVKDFSGQIAEKDVPALISADQSKAEFLVTGDKRHFGKMKGLGEYPFEIVTPSEFIDSILPEILKGLEPPPPLRYRILEPQALFSNLLKRAKVQKRQKKQVTGVQSCQS